MKNIIWQLPTGCLAVRNLSGDEVKITTEEVDGELIEVISQASSEEWATHLLNSHQVASDWVPVAFDRELPTTPQNAWRYVDGAIVSVELPVDFATLKAAETARWMAIREQFFGRLASISSRLYASDPAGSASADAVANSLLGLFTAPTVVAATDIATYKYELKERYKVAIALATPSAAAEFGKYDK